MKKYILLFIGLFILIYEGCEENIVNLPKLCSEEPEFTYTEFKLTIITDDTCLVAVTVDNRGVIFAEYIIIERNGIRKSANIGGYICKDTRFYIDVIYNDTANNSRLKLEGGPIVQNTVAGKIFYCPNENNNCNFVQIGAFSGGHSDFGGIGGFNTPLFMGIFSFTYVQSGDASLNERSRK